MMHMQLLNSHAHIMHACMDLTWNPQPWPLPHVYIMHARPPTHDSHVRSPSLTPEASPYPSTPPLKPSLTPKPHPPEA